jgi:hypothetical protein
MTTYVCIAAYLDRYLLDTKGGKGLRILSQLFLEQIGMVSLTTNLICPTRSANYDFPKVQVKAGSSAG